LPRPTLSTIVAPPSSSPSANMATPGSPPPTLAWTRSSLSLAARRGAAGHRFKHEHGGGWHACILPHMAGEVGMSGEAGGSGGAVAQLDQEGSKEGLHEQGRGARDRMVVCLLNFFSSGVF
jgi:hypothetical protein